MKKSSAKSKGPKVDPFLEGLMGKLMERFASLERKMDTLMAAVASRASGGDQQVRQDFQNQNLQAKERNARRERVMFEAICADCNAPCEVPFRPSEGRAIYCRDCFAKRKSGGSGGHPTPSQPTTPVQSPTEKQAKKKPVVKKVKKKK